MKPDPRLEAYLALCKRTFERMQRDGSWPWRNDDDDIQKEKSEDDL